MEELFLLGAGAVTVLVVAPIVGAAINPELGKSISEGGRNMVKEGIKLGMEVTDNIQGSVAEAGESWNDLVAEAKAERENSRNASKPPRAIEISSENAS